MHYLSFMKVLQALLTIDKGVTCITYLRLRSYMNFSSLIYLSEKKVLLLTVLAAFIIYFGIAASFYY